MRKRLLRIWNDFKRSTILTYPPQKKKNCLCPVNLIPCLFLPTRLSFCVKLCSHFMTHLSPFFAAVSTAGAHIYTQFTLLALPNLSPSICHRPFLSHCSPAISSKSEVVNFGGVPSLRPKLIFHCLHVFISCASSPSLYLGQSVGGQSVCQSFESLFIWQEVQGIEGIAGNRN